AIKDFVGIKRGDVDGSCSECDLPFQGGGSENRSIAQTQILINDQNIKMGETINLPIYLTGWEEDYNTVSFALEFPTALFEIQNIIDSDLPTFNDDCFNWKLMQDGLLRFGSINFDGKPTHHTKAAPLFYIQGGGKRHIAGLSNTIGIRTEL